MFFLLWVSGGKIFFPLDIGGRSGGGRISNFPEKSDIRGGKKGILGGRKKKAGEAVLGYFEVGKTGHKGIRLESEGPRQSAGSFKPFRGVLKAASGVKDDIFVHFRSFGAVLRPSFAVVGFFLLFRVRWQWSSMFQGDLRLFSSFCRFVRLF